MTGKSKTPIKIIGERDIELHLSNPDHHQIGLLKLEKLFLLLSDLIF